MKWIGQHIFDLKSKFRNDVTIDGDLTVSGTYTQIDTDVTTTEQWFVTNDGTGPAAIINQKGSEDIFDVQDDGTSVFYIEDGGNIGIGTTSPNVLLDVERSGAGARIYNTSGSTDLFLTCANGYVSAINFGDSSDNDAGRIVYRDYDNAMTFTTNAAEKMRITSDGNVGIGTVSPGRKLTVVGSDNLTFLDSASNAYLTIDRSATDRRSALVLSTAGDGTSAIPNNINWALGAADSDEVGDGTGFFIGTNTNATSAKLFIEQAGNVGIGVTAPASLLHVAGTVQVGVDDTGHDVIFYGATSGKKLTWDESADSLYFADDTYLRLGDGGDVKMWHNGTDSYIMNLVGDLHLLQSANDKDIILSSDDGSGGTTAYLTLDGSQGFTTVQKKMVFADAISATFGTGGDMDIKHDGSNSFIQNHTGDLTIKNNTDDGDIIFQSDDGAGGLATYFSLDGSGAAHDGSATTSLTTNWPDNSKITLGTSNDLHIWHNGTNSFTDNYTGDFYIRQRADDKDIIFQSDDGSGGVETYFFLDGSLGRTVFPDQSRLVFGSSNDFDMRHYPLNGMMMNNHTDDFVIANYADDKDISFRCDDGSGGTTEYFRLDGGDADGTLTYTKWADNSIVALGTGKDLRMYHNGTNSIIQNYTGNLSIRNGADDGDIIFDCDDGSGGIETYFYLDGSLSSGNPRTIFPDNARLGFGNSGDTYIEHDGSNGYIANSTGHLYIKNWADDKDIIFQSDDGSGGTETYFFLDGSMSSGNPWTIFPDQSRLGFGDGLDLRFYHDGTNSYVENEGGNLYIRNDANDKDIIFQCDDGSDGAETYFYLDGSYGANPYTIFPDNSTLALGTNRDLLIVHDATDSKIDNYVGDLKIRNFADDKDIIFQSDDGSGGTETYFYLDGSASSGNPITIFPDLSALYFGTGTDLMIRHDGTDSTIANNGGDLYITQNTNDKDIIFQCDDGSGGVTSYLTLDGGAGHTIVQKEMNFGDSVEATFGASNDLKVYHSGSHSYMIQRGTGNLYIQQTTNDADIIFTCDDGSGGNTAYLTLDGSEGYTKADRSLVIVDDKSLYLGTGLDLRIYHNQYNSFISNDGAGDLYIMQNTANEDIIFQCDDGSGGVATYMTFDGSRADGTYTYTTLPDSGVMAFGASVDMQLYHNATDSIIRNNTGDLKIINYADDKDIIFQSDDGAGGVETYFFLDGSFSSGNPCTVFPDNANLQLGTSGDMSISHNGSNSFINNATGDLTISVNGTDKDLILKSDDGSGGETAYLTLDGGLGHTTVQKTMRFDDSIRADFGSTYDLQIQHNGTDSYIDNGSGDFYIRQKTDDKDLIFQCDDGAGGTAEYFRLDGSAATHDGSATTGMYTSWPDNSYVTLGDARDLQIIHTGVNSVIQNLVGKLQITSHTDDIEIIQYANDKDIIFQSDDGSGGTATYLTIDGSETKTIVSQTMEFQDNVKLAIGNSEDMTIDHNATDTRVMNYTGDLRILNAADDKDITLECDDGSGGVTPYLTLDGGDVSTIINTIKVLMPNLPTSDPGVAGQLWNSSGDLKVSAG